MDDKEEGRTNYANFLKENI